ncbi:putative folate-biopterin transporter 4-like [Dorcoceras hygrometricum]|uniref:Putative folate-biopterin transporter 4-like n=1 Tax=Dorcoceras hygrometricum TaxID=472368 RepID=A0A2Z7B880_9LAMI|nr:putative folate-biopterin transporter 4-like [Dorcoceras hygrometricum]
MNSRRICPADGSQYKDSAVDLVFMESAAGLAMETSKVESAVRNQAEDKLNQLEHTAGSSLRLDILRLFATLRYFFFSCVWIPNLATVCVELATGYAKLATVFITTAGSYKLSTGKTLLLASGCPAGIKHMLPAGILRLLDLQRKEHLLNRESKTLSSLRLDFLLYDVASLLRLDVQATCWYLATAGLKPSTEYDDVTNDVINAKPSADSSARRRFISFTSLLIC